MTNLPSSAVALATGLNPNFSWPSNTSLGAGTGLQPEAVISAGGQWGIGNAVSLGNYSMPTLHFAALNTELSQLNLSSASVGQSSSAAEINNPFLNFAAVSGLYGAPLAGQISSALNPNVTNGFGFPPSCTGINPFEAATLGTALGSSFKPPGWPLLQLCPCFDCSTNRQ